MGAILKSRSLKEEKKMYQAKPSKDATISFKENKKEISLIGHDKLAYLWIGTEKDGVVTFSGPKSLRKLAKTILKVIPDN